MTDWANRILGHGEESPDDLLAHPMNHRIHSKAQQEALGTVLSNVGLVQSVIVNQRTGFVVDGHLRISLAMRSGQKTIPVTYVDLSDDEERIILASLDAIGAMAVEDSAKLSELIQSVESEDASILALLAAVSAGEKMPPLDETMPMGDTKTITCPSCGATWEA
jgi:ParB-like chromosome segregation protein Spo0J